MVTYSFEIFKAMLEVDYEALTKFEYDSFICISGEEGSGKSMLSLWALEIWLNLKYGKFEQNDFYKYFGVKLSEYARVLATVKKFDINVCDESSDIFGGKHSNTKIVRKIEDTYTVIRGDSLMTIWNIPSFFLLSPYFRNWRIRCVWYVEKRGLCHVYHKPKRMKLSEMNESKDMKDYFLEKPLFSFVFPKYNGIFLEPYLKMKNKKMESVRVNFEKAVTEWEED